MRIWSLHPQYLDTAGLAALWRETLLAQAVLAGRTKGYTRHPQLERFRATPNPSGAIAAYLDGVLAEAQRRGFNYDPSRIDDIPRWEGSIPVQAGQIALEVEHLRGKLAKRDPGRIDTLILAPPLLHPLFHSVEGGVESWEKAVIAS
ncbi:MAG: pyrimidine dimer DNA glycosylase/endonuclease V [Actinomycetaceae bacterium]|nr:pyrimidine dimer DNA glycosylase/endonuclease V [Actinomycetaceae bacterium]